MKTTAKPTKKRRASKRIRTMLRKAYRAVGAGDIERAEALLAEADRALLER